MAISLTTDGLRLDYRTEEQESVSGTYPIGTVIVSSAQGSSLSLPGTWASICRFPSSHKISIESSIYLGSWAIRIE